MFKPDPGRTPPRRRPPIGGAAPWAAGAARAGLGGAGPLGAGRRARAGRAQRREAPGRSRAAAGSGHGNRPRRAGGPAAFPTGFPANAPLLPPRRTDADRGGGCRPLRLRGGGRMQEAGGDMGTGDKVRPGSPHRVPPGGAGNRTGGPLGPLCPHAGRWQRRVPVRSRLQNRETASLVTNAG